MERKKYLQISFNKIIFNYAFNRSQSHLYLSREVMGALPTHAYHAVYKQNYAVNNITHSAVPEPGPYGSRHKWWPWTVSES